MLLHANDIAELGRKLDSAKKEPSGWCKKKNTPPEGTELTDDKKGYRDWQKVSGPARRNTNPDGTKKWEFEKRDEGWFKLVTIPLGEHGIAHMGINPSSGDVQCMKCAKGD